MEKGPLPVIQVAALTSTGNRKSPLRRGGECGAGDEIRTRDIYLGKVVLYQLSYSRILKSIILDTSEDDTFKRLK